MNPPGSTPRPRRALAAVALCIAATACAHHHPAPPPTSTPPATAVPADLLNPDVTQDTIAQTICAAGWTATIRPPTSYTTPLKRRQIAERNLPDTDPAHYEEDHLIPIELGGAPRNPANLWPELRAAYGGTAEDKDQAENAAKTAVCAGRAALAAAQLDMYIRWRPTG